MSTWRRRAQELYPDLSGPLEKWDRTEWNTHFERILCEAVETEDTAAVGKAVRYLAWCWGQRTADPQFFYFVENSVSHLLKRPADKSAFCAVADGATFATFLGVFADFHEKREVDDLEREFRLRPKANKSR